MSNRLVLFLMLIAFVLMAGNCEQTKDCDYTGTVKDMSGLDACTFIIEANNGDRFEPVEIPDGFTLVDGMKVSFSYETVEMMSACMAGTPVRISCIAELAGKGSADLTE